MKRCWLLILGILLWCANLQAAVFTDQGPPVIREPVIASSVPVVIHNNLTTLDYLIAVLLFSAAWFFLRVKVFPDVFENSKEDSSL